MTDRKNPPEFKGLPPKQPCGARRSPRPETARATVALVQNGEELGSVVVTDSAPVVFGRDDSCDVCVDDASVSERHAQLILRNGAVCIEDLGSGAGTVLDGAPVSGVRVLGALNSVGMGGWRVELRVIPQVVPPAAAVRPAPSAVDGPRGSRGPFSKLGPAGVACACGGLLLVGWIVLRMLGSLAQGDAEREGASAALGAGQSEGKVSVEAAVGYLLGRRWATVRPRSLAESAGGAAKQFAFELGLAKAKPFKSFVLAFTEGALYRGDPGFHWLYGVERITEANSFGHLLLNPFLIGADGNSRASASRVALDANIRAVSAGVDRFLAEKDDTLLREAVFHLWVTLNVIANDVCPAQDIRGAMGEGAGSASSDGPAARGGQMTSFGTHAPFDPARQFENRINEAARSGERVDRIAESALAPRTADVGRCLKEAFGAVSATSRLRTVTDGGEVLAAGSLGSSGWDGSAVLDFARSDKTRWRIYDGRDWYTVERLTFRPRQPCDGQFLDALKLLRAEDFRPSCYRLDSVGELRLRPDLAGPGQAQFRTFMSDARWSPVEVGDGPEVSFYIKGRNLRFVSMNPNYDPENPTVRQLSNGHVRMSVTAAPLLTVAVRWDPYQYAGSRLELWRKPQYPRIDLTLSFGSVAVKCNGNDVAMIAGPALVQ